MKSKKVIIHKNGSGDSDNSNTLVIIDGVKHTDKDAFSSLDPDEIVSVDVINDKKLMKKYSDKDYGAVIVVVTKAKKK